MELEFVKALREHLNYEPRSYSGRGMFGKKCLGVVCNNPTNVVLELISFFAENVSGQSAKETCEDVVELCEMLRGSSQDSMGHDTIIYWPNIEWKDEWDEFEGSDDDSDDE